MLFMNTNICRTFVESYFSYLFDRAVTSCQEAPGQETVGGPFKCGMDTCPNRGSERFILAEALF